LLRHAAATQWNTTAADSLQILYGGSVTPQNIAGFLSSEQIDGALVGGACLDPGSFATLAKITSEIRATRR
jgi:triosephosphate isomerase